MAMRPTDLARRWIGSFAGTRDQKHNEQEFSWLFCSGVPERDVRWTMRDDLLLFWIIKYVYFFFLEFKDCNLRELGEVS